nr:hypothetical protein [Escherichia coli]
MEIFWKPLGMGAVAVFIGIVLLWLALLQIVGGDKLIIPFC